MKAILNKLFEHQKLTENEAYEVLTNIGNGAYNSSQVASFLTVFMMRNISTEELKGFQTALLDLCLKIDFSEFNTIDLCGTGGDGKNTFNISTITSFVVAGAGYKVAKHGNYGVSSTCGSSNVLEYLGYKFTNDESILKKQLEETNFCMMHAPLFHPAMKNVAPIRTELGVKTFFNMLGPIVNPSKPKNQMVGVFNLELARVYNYLFQNSDKNFKIIHSVDGYDEISLTNSFKHISNQGESIISPKEIGFSYLNETDIYGGTSIKDAAKIFTDIIENKGTVAQNNVVIANAAFAIQCFEPEKSLTDCQSIALESLKSEAALNTFKKIIS